MNNQNDLSYNTLTNINDYSKSSELVRQLPSNIQAEQILLGVLLLNCELIYKINNFLDYNHFFHPLHKKIYQAIEIIIKKGLIATPITLDSMLNKEQQFQASGGVEYLVKLTTLSMTIISPYDYAKIIYELAIKRNLITIGENIVNDAYDKNLESSALEQIKTAENKLYMLATNHLNEKKFQPIYYSINKSIERINKAITNNTRITGISTGLVDLDRKLSGFHNSDLIILAARPSMGKTTFAINFAYTACNELNKSNNQESIAVGFFSLEMSAEQLASRLLSMVTKINSVNLRNGDIKEESYNDLKNAANDLSDLQLYIDDTPALSIASIRARARQLKREHNVGIIFIDYLQLIHSTNKNDNRVLEISEITGGLKALAKELDIPVVALSQLSRAVEHRENKRPMLSDLRESGAIEQDADVVMFLFHEKYYLLRKEPGIQDPKYIEWQEQLNQCNNLIEVIIAKHRNGAVGNISLYYSEESSTITNLQKLNNIIPAKANSIHK